MSAASPGKFVLIELDSQFCVAFLATAQSDWLHVLARFSDRVRAERYCDIENDILRDDPNEMDADAKEPPPRLLPPPSRVTPENFRPIGNHSEFLAAETVPAIEAPGENHPESDAPAGQGSEKRAQGHPFAQGAERIETVLAWIKAQGADPVHFKTQTALAGAAGIPRGSLHYVLDKLEDDERIAGTWFDEAGFYIGLKASRPAHAWLRVGSRPHIAETLSNLGTPAPAAPSVAPPAEPVVPRLAKSPPPRPADRALIDAAIAKGKVTTIPEGTIGAPQIVGKRPGGAPVTEHRAPHGPAGPDYPELDPACRWLQQTGVTVVPAGKPGFTIEGKLKSAAELLAWANDRRRRRGLAQFAVGPAAAQCTTPGCTNIPLKGYPEKLCQPCRSKMLAAKGRSRASMTDHLGDFDDV